MSLQIISVDFHGIFHTRCLILVIFCTVIHSACDLLCLTTSCSAQLFYSISCFFCGSVGSFEFGWLFWIIKYTHSSVWYLSFATASSFTALQVREIAKNLPRIELADIIQIHAIFLYQVLHGANHLSVCD